MHLFETVPSLSCSEDIPNFPFSGKSALPDEVLEKPFIVSIPADHNTLLGKDSPLGSLVSDFGVAFEASPLRMTAG